MTSQSGQRCLCSKPMHVGLKHSAVPCGPPGPDHPDVASFLQGTDIWTTCSVLLLQLEAVPKLSVVLQPAFWKDHEQNQMFDLLLKLAFLLFWAGFL